MKITIYPITITRYQSVIAEAMDEGSRVIKGQKYGITPPDPTAEYFGAFDDADVFMGFFGIKWQGTGQGTSCYFRSAYVRYFQRRKGAYRAMVDYTICLARAKGVEVISVICTPPSLPAWLKSGAAVLQVYKNGNTKIKLELRGSRSEQDPQK